MNEENNLTQRNRETEKQRVFSLRFALPQYSALSTQYFFAVVLLLLAFALRVHLLDAQSLWNDEGNSVVQAGRSLSEIANHAARDIHPPGYYWLLSGWRLLAGETEFALRALSTFASILSVAFTYHLGRRLYSAGAGLAAAALVAVNTFSIYYAQEARMYALLAMWAAAGMVALVSFVERPGWQRGFILALVNAAGLWTQYGYAFVMLAQGALVVAWLLADALDRRWRDLLYTLGIYVITSFATIALYLPWLPTALNQITTWPSTGASVPFGEALGLLLNWLAYGATFEYSASGALAVANMLLLFGLFTRYGERRAWWRTLVPFAWVVVSVGVFLAFQLLRPSNIKLLLPAQIGLALWMARGVWMLWHFARNERQRVQSQSPDTPSQSRRALLLRFASVVGGVWLLANTAAGIGALYADPDYQRDDYRAIVREIETALRAGDAIILDAPNQEEVFRYYYSGDAPVYTLPPGLGGDDEATRAAVHSLIDAHERVFVVFWGEAERDPNRIVETTLDAETFEVGDMWYGDVRLARYVMPRELGRPIELVAQFGDHITLERYALSSAEITPGDVLQVRLDWSTDAPLETRYKVFVQLLDENGVLVAQRDSEPGGGLALTTTWIPGETVQDNHGLLIPDNLTGIHYLLITGLYDINPPHARLRVGGEDFVILRELTLAPPME